MLRNPDRLEPRQGLRKHPTRRSSTYAPAGPRKFRVFRLQNTKILEKIARCARQGMSEGPFKSGPGRRIEQKMKTLPK